ncbi:MAG TPA: hypothetical protein VFJ16_22200, partial [Longimicrobium sp.]|nr:hypothetical protein [Longimicrobium sp.]
ASVGAIPLAPAAEGDRETVPAPVLPAGRIRQAFLSGAAVRVRAVAGPPPRALAQLLGIYRPALQSEVLLVGIDGEDVVVRVRSRAVPLRLRSPEMRFRRALAGVQPGDTFSLAVRRVRGGIEVRRGGGGGTRLGVTPGGGWAMLYGVDRAAPPLLAALGAAWMALLMLPLGLWLRATRLALLPLTITAAGLAALPPAVGLMPARWWEIGGALAGIGLGAVIARVSRPRSRR